VERPSSALLPCKRTTILTGVESHSGANGRRPRILIAEDDESLRALIRLTIEVGDVEIREVADGEAALEDARRSRPDLVLLDWSMPGRSGLEVCRELRANADTSGATIVMITARAQEADRRAGLEAGADRYLTKPFSPLELLDTLRDVLGPDALA
jgi:two-component system, OmpR family, phosphate regulon response regulator PhoB